MRVLPADGKAIRSRRRARRRFHRWAREARWWLYHWLLPRLDGYERCVLCDRKTPVKLSVPIDDRVGYVEGTGQLCRECFEPASSDDEQIGRS